MMRLLLAASLFLHSSYTPKSSGGITALTGDVTASGTGSVASTLATTQTAAHTFSGALTLSGGVTISTNNLVMSGGNAIDVRNTGSIMGVGNSAYGSHTVQDGGTVITSWNTSPTGDTFQIGALAQFIDSAATGITAAGTTQASCTQLTADHSNVTTVAAGAGVCLPPTAPGAHFVVHTSGANSLLIYANPGGGTLNGQVATAAVTLVNAGGTAPGTRVIDCYSSTLCFSGATIADAN